MFDDSNFYFSFIENPVTRGQHKQVKSKDDDSKKIKLKDLKHFIKNKKVQGNLDIKKVKLPGQDLLPCM